MRQLHPLVRAVLSHPAYQFLLLLLLPAGAAVAQPTITGLNPVRNARTAARSGNVAITFSQNMGGSSSSAVRVFSAQAGGRKAGPPATVAGNTVSFNPNTNFKAGETLFATVRTTAESSGGVNLAAPQVFQFTTATSPGTGTFNGGSDLGPVQKSNDLALGDLTGDGIPDLALALPDANLIQLRPGYGDGTFGPAQTVSATAPRSLTLADVNGDGDLDLLASGENDDLVRVFTNNGTGTFTAAGNTTMGSRPDELTTGDVDGDGDLDLVAINVVAEAVVVRLNNGSGAFAGGSTVALPEEPRAVQLADLNNDGDLDLLIGTDEDNNSDGMVLVRHNNGSGSFGAGSSLALASDASGLAVGDVDGDGDLDMVTTHHDGAVVGRNNGSGTFTVSTVLATKDVSGGTHAPSLHDVDGDGDLDLVFVSTSSENLHSDIFGGWVEVKLNNGAGVFTPGSITTVGSDAEKMQLADLDNDGDLDLVVSPDPDESGLVNVRLNEGRFAVVASAPTRNQRHAPAATPVALTFNGSPLNATASAVRVFGQQAGGKKDGAYAVSGNILSFSPATGFKPGEKVDVSVPDAVLSSGGAAARAHILQFTAAATGGLGTFTSAPSVSFPSETNALLADMNGDGNLDVVAIGTTTDQLEVRLGNGSGGFGPGSVTASPGLHFNAVKTADVDADGDLDLVAVLSTNEVRLFKNNGNATFAAEVDIPVGDMPWGLALADVDADGDLDIVTANRVGHSLSLRLNNGGGVFGDGGEVPLGHSTRDVVAADLNGDGDLDLLATDASNDAVTVLFNSGTGSFSARPAVPVGDIPQRMVAGDIDGDGDMDFLTADYGGFTVSVRLNNGQGEFSNGATLPVVNTGQSGPDTVELNDVDGDGDLDLLIGGETLTLRRNNGFGTFGPPTTLAAAGQPQRLAVGDVDNDGDLDFVNSDYDNPGPLKVFLNQDAFAVTSVSPTRHQPNAPRASDVVLTFSQNVHSGTANRIRVFGQQLQGRKAGSYSAAANNLTFNPPQSFKPNELVSVTVPTTVLSSSANQPARAHVYQFRAAAGVGPGTFAAAPDVPIGGFVNCPTTADVNGDGKLDLFANVGADVSLFLGNGDGTFGPATVVAPAVNTIIHSMVTGDVDGDGDLDLAVGVTLHSEVRVFLNNGFGAFTPGYVVPLSYPIYSIDLGDLDGDSDLDLITPHGVYLNNGSGSFNFSINAGVYLGGHYGLALGDMDNDGDLDAVTTNSVVFNNGTGLLGSAYNFPEMKYANMVLLGDLDADGDLDLVVPNATYGHQNVWVRFNDGSGALSDPLELPTPASDCYEGALGDVDGDGDLDIIVDGDMTSLLRNNGDGTFATPELTSTPGGYKLALGDLDNDGDLDFITRGGFENLVVRLNANPLLITGLSPTRNLRNAAAGSSVAVTFNQPISSSPASVASVQVFSSQRGGRLNNLDGSASVNGSTITFDPTTSFKPGETIQATVTTAATSGTNVAVHLAEPHVYQFTVAATGGTATFINAPNVATGARPNVVTTADVNGDGKLDMVVANEDANSVTLHLGNGDGTFGTGTVINANIPLCYSIVVADIDGDGDLDLLLADYIADIAALYKNNGAGTFSAAGSVAVGNDPEVLAVADLDGDGDLDLAAGGADNNVNFRYNDGNGVFSGTGSFTILGFAFTRNIALGDMDADGRPDMVVSNEMMIEVWRNTGSGQFALLSSVAAASSISGIMLGDLDGDGDLDVVAPDGANNTAVRFNNGAGQLSGTLAYTTSNGAYKAALGDLDGDGDLDIIVADGSTDNTSTVLLNDGTGTFVVGTPINTPGGHSVALGDLDDDGDLDALFTNSSNTGATVSVRLNEAQPLVITALSPTRNLRNALRPSPVAVTFNQPISGAAASVGSVRVFSQQRGGQVTGTATANGNTIILAPAHPFQPGETVYTTVTTDVKSTVGGTLAAPHVYQFTVAVTGGLGSFVAAPSPAAASPVAVVTGDVDGDGDLDLVTASRGTEQVASVRLNAGNGTFTNAPDVPTGVSALALALADVDGDGDLDLLVSATSVTSSLVMVWRNDGSGSFSAAGSVSVGAMPRQVLLRDVDGDGDLDLLTANGGNSTASVRLNDGTGAFSGGTDPGTNGATSGIAVGDVDADGDLDLISVSQTSSLASLRRNNGSGTFGGGGLPNVGSAPICLTLADVDGDGDLDLLVGSADNAVRVRFNNGTGTFSAGPEVSLPAAAEDVATGDVDGDGDLDLLVTHAGAVSVRFNDGAGSFGGGSDNTLDPGALALAPGDLDGDGDLDFAVGSAAANAVHVLLNEDAAPLPVELARFTAERRGSAALLRWTTAQEQHNAGFDVEVSVDGRMFRRLGFVAGRGHSSTVQAYDYTDENLLHHGASPVVYYRLHQLDTDGQGTYSPVRTLTVGEAATATAPAIYPNPASASTPRTLVGAVPQQPLSLLDALGREVLRFLPDASGRAQLQLPANLTPGIYLLATPGKTLRVVVTE